MKNEPMTSAQAVAHVKAQTGNPDKFRVRHRGFVDWKFGELSEYLGYAKACDYIHSVRRWHDFISKYADCLLERTYADFVAADKNQQK